MQRTCEGGERKKRARGRPKCRLIGSGHATARDGILTRRDQRKTETRAAIRVEGMRRSGSVISSDSKGYEDRRSPFLAS
jgi:hypothetical protein